MNAETGGIVTSSMIRKEEPKPVFCSGTITSNDFFRPMIVASGAIGGGAWEQSPVKSNPVPKPAEPPKPSEWVKWSDFKPEVGSKINWGSSGNPDKACTDVFKVVADGDSSVRDSDKISSEWVRTGGYGSTAIWRYVDGKPTPAKKEIERIDGWVRWRDEKPQAGRKMVWGSDGDKPDPKWWTGRALEAIEVTAQFLVNVNVDRNKSMWWKYADDPQADKLKAEGWIPVSERLPGYSHHVRVHGCDDDSAYWHKESNTWCRDSQGVPGAKSWKGSESTMHPTHWKENA